MFSPQGQRRNPKRARRLFFLGASLLFGLPVLSVAQPSEIQFEDPGHDYAFLEVEPYSGFTAKDTLNTSGAKYGRIADQISFPIGMFNNHFMFGSIKNTVINRDVVYDGQKLNQGPLQRYWLAGGIELIDSPRHNSYLMAAVGLNSDLADLGRRDFNSEWIYTHSFTLRSNFHWGFGLDLQEYSGRFVDFFPVVHKWQIAAYPLFYLDWRFSDNTKFIWDADFLELRQFFFRKLAVTAGARFNLEFFALKRDATYQYRSVGAETGLQYSLGRHTYLRLKYKELLAGEEFVGLTDGTLHRGEINSGRSVRLNLAYGI